MLARSISGSLLFFISIFPFDLQIDPPQIQGFRGPAPHPGEPGGRGDDVNVLVGSANGYREHGDLVSEPLKVEAHDMAYR
jgi:hypothetical protein